MEEKESKYILSSDGFQLNYSINEVASPLAMVCLFHGYGEHLGRYQHVVNHLGDHRISCLSLDFRGHGGSQGKRGHFSSVDQILEDMEEALKIARRTDLESPLFLFGHSFGGSMVLNYVLRKPVMELAGFMASSPWLELAFQPPKWKVNLGKVMSSIWPGLSLPTELDFTKLSRDIHVQKLYEQDPLVHNRMSARFYAEATRAGVYVQDHLSNLTINGLVYQGTQDAIIRFSSTKASVSKSDKIQFEELDGVYHEPHNDIGKEFVLELVSDWIIRSINTKLSTV